MKSFPFLVSGALTALLVERTRVLRALRPRGRLEDINIAEATPSFSPLTSHMSAWNGANTSRAFVDGLCRCGRGHDTRPLLLTFLPLTCPSSPTSRV